MYEATWSKVRKNVVVPGRHTTTTTTTPQSRVRSTQPACGVPGATYNRYSGQLLVDTTGMLRRCGQGWWRLVGIQARWLRDDVRRGGHQWRDDVRRNHQATAAGRYEGEHGRRLEGRNHEGMGQQQEKEYHKLTKQWSVPRTSLKYFPEETQQVILQRGRDNGKEMHEETLHRMGKVLEFEKKNGNVDCQGRGGQRFSSWMKEHLREMGTWDALFTSGEEKVLRKLVDDAERYRDVDREYRLKFVERCSDFLEEVESRYTSAPVQRKHRSGSSGLSGRSRRAVPEPQGGLLGGIPSDSKYHDLHHVEGTEERKKRGEEYGSEGKQGMAMQTDSGKEKRRKASTREFRKNFMMTALTDSQSSHHSVNELQGDQRTELWKSLRDRRLTASSFSKALGFFPGDRISLWEEKIGIREPFKGNDATKWGTANESRALETYQILTGLQVESCMFRVKRDDIVHDWLGASPDGLVAGLGIVDSSVPFQNNGTDSGLHGPGVLEIKCPYNKGHPEVAVPPSRAIWYYMPQIQGLMDVFDREWCSLYVWTAKRGSASFLIQRNREYWSACFDVLAEFWWVHTVPARQAMDSGGSVDDVRCFEPTDLHETSEKLKLWSKELAWSAPGKVYPHVDLD